MSIELAMAGLKVRALERGADRGYEEFAYPKPADEYAYAVRNKVMATPAEAAVTVRYNMSQTALPTRKWGAFCGQRRGRFRSALDGGSDPSNPNGHQTQNLCGSGL